MVDDHVEEAVVDMVQNNFQEMRSLKKVKNAKDHSSIKHNP